MLIRLFLSAFLILAVLPVRAQESAPVNDVDRALVAKAQRLIDDLMASRYDEVVATFDSTMKQQLSVDQIIRAHIRLTRQMGSFVERAGTSTEVQEPYRIVTVALQFERAVFDGRVVFDPEGRVTGLFFVPNPEAAAYVPPTYADTTAFRERPIRIAADGGPTLPGTLTMPHGQGPFPAVVLVHGSGPQDRDQSVGPNKPFRDVAYGLATRGVAVLRYDKRTFTNPEAFAPGTPYTVEEEVLADARAAVRALDDVPEVDAGRLFVLGHSLGAMLAPRLLQDDETLSGAILLAAPARPFPEVVRDQADYLGRHDTTAATRLRLRQLRTAADHIDSLTADVPDTRHLLGAPVSYWRDLQAYEPVATARTVDVPLLVLHGGRDYQVTDADHEAWVEGLARQPNTTVTRYPSLNHLFVRGEGPSLPSDYEMRGHVDATVVEDVARWIKEQ